MEVKIKNVKLDIKPLPLGKYAELMRAFDKLPTHFNSLAGIDNNEAIKRIPVMLADGLPEIEQVLSIGSGMKKEEIDELSLDEATDLFLAIFKVNNYSGVFEKVKKAFTPPKTE